MSKLGKIPLVLPKEVKLNVTSTAVAVEGPKGKLSEELLSGIKIEQKEQQVFLTRVNDVKQSRANHGTMRALLQNMIIGVTQGHVKNLEIHGLGFRAAVSGQKLTMHLGFSHPVDFMAPAGVKISLPKPTEIKLEGSDKMLLGLTASQIRRIKPPEPYKGKGIRYAGEVVKRKQGKSVTK